MRQVVIIANGFQEEYIYNFVNGLSKTCSRVVLIGGENYDRSRLSINVSFNPLRGRHFHGESFIRKTLRSIRYYIHLILFIVRSRINTVHLAWLRFPIIDGIFIPIILKMFKIRIVYTAHNPLPHHKEGWYFRFIFRMIYRISDFIIVHTDHIKNLLVREIGVDSKKIYMVEHGLYDVTETPEINSISSKKYFNLESRKPVLLFFGKIVHYKGLDLLLESMVWDDIHMKFQILIAGRVGDAYKDQFDKLIDNYPFSNLTILDRYLTDKEVEMCFKAADLTVLPYREASQSGVMLMSFSFGIPVVVPDLGSFPEYVNGGATGLLFHSNDWESLGKVLSEYLSQPDQFQKKDILSIASTKYSWDDACRTISDIYNN
ncbi:glycosyltransferase family 4 protein [Lunatibacter salilacus]|uniref:glycosyltransferase family 4 protein n=1 Tax=Lunatibacter salilacus TaxID=2483804 RepID=UPI00131B7C5C|nr:glycosyltransferase family 4 protein [Lunatibacter salilacus]